MARHPIDRRAFLRVAGAASAGLMTLNTRTLARYAPSPAFIELPPAETGIKWVHNNAMSPDRYLPETCGSGCAFLDFDNDGWMDLYLVNSGPADFFTPKTPLQNALYKNNRDGTFTDVTEKAGVPGGTFGMGAQSATTTMTAIPNLLVTSYGQVHAVSQQRQRYVHRRHQAGRARGPGLDHERGLVRLRQRWQARSVPVQLRRFLADDQSCSAATTSSVGATTAFLGCSSRHRACSSTTMVTGRSPKSEAERISEKRSEKRSVW